MSTNRTEKEQVRVHIRWMIRRDMPEVLQTEQESFEYRLDRGRLPALPAPAQLHRHGGRAGREGRRLHDLRAAQEQAAHPQLRRPPALPAPAASAPQMVAKLISKLSSHRRTRITLEVRETNLAAQLFFRTQGFKAVRVLRTFYEDSGEDAFLHAVPPRRRHRRRRRGDASTASPSTKRAERTFGIHTSLKRNTSLKREGFGPNLRSRFRLVLHCPAASRLGRHDRIAPAAGRRDLFSLGRPPGSRLVFMDRRRVAQDRLDDAPRLLDVSSRANCVASPFMASPSSRS